MDYTEKLLELGEKLIAQSEKLIDATKKLQEAEENYKLLRAKVFNLDRVQQQPNQTLRESEADTIMNNDERFKPLYVNYLTNKLNQREQYIRYEVTKELVTNYRTLLNNMTYSGVK